MNYHDVRHRHFQEQWYSENTESIPAIEVESIPQIVQYDYMKTLQLVGWFIVGLISGFLAGVIFALVYFPWPGK